MMDLLAKWKQRMHDYPTPTLHTQESTVAGLVQGLVSQHEALWWACEGTLPAFSRSYSRAAHIENDRKLEKWINGLIYELKRLPQSAQEREAWQERLRPGITDFARLALNLEQPQLAFIELTGMVQASQTFARMAREFDPQISAEDIFQAGRNIMTANFMQLLLGLPVEVTPSVFAYSMLYPYTDNYLDDPAISGTAKLAFNHRFQCRLAGEEIRPANANEVIIHRLIGMIEGQWDREQYPQVYESLQAIHAAQARSLELVVPGASPYELDVLRVSFEKGGTSVLADGYLAAGWLSAEQAALMFGYGAFTQLMDDLEDIEQDMREARMTVFSQTANHWPLDGLTNRLFHFGRAIFKDLSMFPSPVIAPMKDLIDRGIDPVLIDIVGQTGKYYSKAYLQEIEEHAPFHISKLRKQREKLTRKKVSLSALVNTMI